MAVLGILVGYFVLKGPFVRWRVRRLAATAEALINRGDRNGAALTAQSILQIDPKNIEASGIIARCAEEDRSPLALFWRQRLVELEPGQSGPLLELARAALSLREFAAAESALDQVPAGDRNTAAFHDVTAAWALSLKQYAAAQQQEEEAVRLDPHSPRLRLSLAALKLVVGGTAASAGARADLEALRKNTESHTEATRDLLADALRRGDGAAAMELGRNLDSAPDAKTTDHLLFLEALRRARNAEFEPRLVALQASATQPGTIFAIMEWMTGNGLGARAIAWHLALPSKCREMPEPLAVAEACVAQGDWEHLRDLIHGAQWGDFEFLRLAYDTRLIDEDSRHGRGVDFKDRWQRTIFSTGGNSNAIAMLARMARSWGWKEQAAQLWWSLANRRIGQGPALAALYEMGKEDKNARELYRVSRRIYQVQPASPAAKNNVAMFALLLREDLPEAHKMAAENYAVAPAEPAIASTYAFSLYLQGRRREAVAVMAKLPPAALNDPSISACNGELLQAAGESAKARPFLDLAEREKARLFPQEVEMVEQALSRP